MEGNILFDVGWIITGMQHHTLNNLNQFKVHHHNMIMKMAVV